MTLEPADVPSPCVEVCVLDPTTGYCLGCWRTLEEIATWSGLTREEKLRLLTRLPARRARVSARSDAS